MKREECLQEFKEKFGRWVEVFGLWDHEYYFALDTDMDDLASVACNSSAKINVVKVNPDLISKQPRKDEQEIRDTASHECLEVLFDPLYALATARSFSEEAWETEVHRIIHRIQHAYAELQKEKNRDLLSPEDE